MFERFKNLPTEEIIYPESQMPPMDRRQFLGKAARFGTLGAIGLASSYGAKLGVDQFLLPLKDQSLDWNEAGLSNQEFFEKNFEKLQNLRLGTTFTPEMFDISATQFDRSDAEYMDRHTTAVNCLKFAVKEMGMRDIRFGMQWQNVEREDGAIDLSFYQDFINVMANPEDFSDVRREELNICFAVGYKTPRYPETHAPEYLETSSLNPGMGAVITSGDEYGRKALTYIDNVCAALKENVEPMIPVKMMQVENEPRQKFGEYRQTLSYGYLKEAMGRANGYFPNAHLLINAGVSSEIAHITESLIPYIHENLPQLESKIHFGLDVYYQKPGLTDQPIIGALDPITRTQIVGGEIFENAKREAKKQNFKIEITEGQAENWHEYDMPGESARGFRYMIKRCIDELMDLSEPSVLRLWGIEKMYKKIYAGFATQEHAEMIDMAHRINSVGQYKNIQWG